DMLAEEVTATWRIAAPESNLKEARAPGMVQLVIRPNLIVQRRRVPANADLNALVAQVCADLVRNIQGLSPVDATGFAFADGKDGSLIKYTMPGYKEFKIAQMQAMRLDDDVVTTASISTELTRLNPAVLEDYLKCLASIAVAR
ncbi:MAG TPA: hypothetical protein VGO62_02030, partial [Myxococcota bacterium]